MRVRRSLAVRVHSAYLLHRPTMPGFKLGTDTPTPRASNEEHAPGPYSASKNSTDRRLKAPSAAIRAAPESSRRGHAKIRVKPGKNSNPLQASTTGPSVRKNRTFGVPSRETTLLRMEADPQ